MSLPRIGLYIIAMTLGALLVLPPLREGGGVRHAQAQSGGVVSIESSPSGIRAFLHYGIGTGATMLAVITPHVENDLPAGQYRVTYIAPEGCRPVLPMRRTLEQGGHIVFTKSFPCMVRPVATQDPTPRPESKTSPTPPPEQSRSDRAGLPRRTEKLLLLSLVTGTPEVTSRGDARFILRLQNRGDQTLRNLSVILRFDPSVLSPLDLARGDRGDNQILWTISALAPQSTWERPLSFRVRDDLAQGSHTLVTAAVSGRGIATIPLRERSAQTAVAVLASLPETGAPLSALELLYRIVGAGTLAGIFVMRKRG